MAHSATFAQSVPPAQGALLAQGLAQCALPSPGALPPQGAPILTVGVYGVGAPLIGLKPDAYGAVDTQMADPLVDTPPTPPVPALLRPDNPLPFHLPDDMFGLNEDILPAHANPLENMLPGGVLPEVEGGIAASLSGTNTTTTPSNLQSHRSTPGTAAAASPQAGASVTLPI